MPIAKSQRFFSGERTFTKSARVPAGSGAQLIISGVSGERSVVSLRFVNTHATDDYVVNVWFVPKEETLGTEHLFYPNVMTVKAGKAFMEPGTKDSPLYTLGYGAEMHVETVSGEGNVFYTISEDAKC